VGEDGFAEMRKSHLPITKVVSANPKMSTYIV